MPLYVLVNFVGDQMDSLLDCLHGYGDGTVLTVKAFGEGLFCVRHCGPCFKGRSQMTSDNLTIQYRDSGEELRKFLFSPCDLGKCLRLSCFSFPPAAGQKNPFPPCCFWRILLGWSCCPWSSPIKWPWSSS